MALPITAQNFSDDLDRAKATFNQATQATDPDLQRNYALLAAAAAQIALAEATWLAHQP